MRLFARCVIKGDNVSQFLMYVDVKLEKPVSQDQVFAEWKEREATAESMIPLIGRLYRDRNIETSVYGRLIVKRSVIDVLKAHRFARQMESQELTVQDTYLYWRP